MENRRILIDTSVIIDYLRSSGRQITLLVRLFNKYELCLSVISVFELYNGAVSTSKKHDIQILCNEFSDIDLALISNDFSGNRFLDKEKIRNFVVKINTDISPMPFRPEDFTTDNIFASEILKNGIQIQ